MDGFEELVYCRLHCWFQCCAPLPSFGRTRIRDLWAQSNVRSCQQQAREVAVYATLKLCIPIFKHSISSMRRVPNATAIVNPPVPSWANSSCHQPLCRCDGTDTRPLRLVAAGIAPAPEPSAMLVASSAAPSTARAALPPKGVLRSTKNARVSGLRVRQIVIGKECQSFERERGWRRGQRKLQQCTKTSQCSGRPGGS